MTQLSGRPVYSFVMLSSNVYKFKVANAPHRILFDAGYQIVGTQKDAVLESADVFAMLYSKAHKMDNLS